MALQLTDSNFKEQVLDSNKLVLVDFGAEWACKALEPTIEQLSNECR
jgi:thioredoxin 1